MISLVLVFLLSLQGIPILPQGGVVTGVLRTAAGAPASRVRVAATTAADGATDSAAALVVLGETDEGGRFVLASVPPGRYYIVAGRVDLPTVYPGTQEIAKGTVVTVTSGASVSGIDFVIADSSYRPAISGRSAPFKTQLSVPVLVSVEGGGPVPFSVGGQSAMIRLVPVGAGQVLEIPLGGNSITVPVTAGVVEEYRVRIDNLPDGYVVKSMKFRSTDLITETLKASLANLSPVPVPRIVTFVGEGELQRLVDEAMQHMADLRKLSITLALDPRAQPSR